MGTCVSWAPLTIQGSVCFMKCGLIRTLVTWAWWAWSCSLARIRSLGFVTRSWGGLRDEPKTTSEWEAISRSSKTHLVNLQLIKGEILWSACHIYQSSLKQFFFVAVHHHSSKSSRQGFRACHCTTCCRNSRYQLLSVNTIIPWGYHSSRYFWAGTKLVQFIVHLRLVSSLGRAPVCWAGGRGFKSRRDQHSGLLITENKVLPL